MILLNRGDDIGHAHDGLLRCLCRVNQRHKPPNRQRDKARPSRALVPAGAETYSKILPIRQNQSADSRD
jgi:hypothetical protein